MIADADNNTKEEPFLQGTSRDTLSQAILKENEFLESFTISNDIMVPLGRLPYIAPEALDLPRESMGMLYWFSTNDLIMSTLDSRVLLTVYSWSRLLWTNFPQLISTIMVRMSRL